MINCVMKIQEKQNIFLDYQVFHDNLSTTVYLYMIFDIS